ncbi:fatty acyl-AMP ligase [Pendulispora albinea]|uniref:Fatty acyl-AMP ligase n=1 Tax=Pendulispora albinea TaxID=2741071 RepID=A0ABZ2LYS6_9BACT
MCRPIAEIVGQRAAIQGGALALTYLHDGENDAESWTYAQLWQAVSRVAADLSARGAAGKRAVLLYEPGLEYIAAFLGTMASGAIAVPAYPPASKRMAERLRGVIQDCSPDFVLTSAAFAAVFQGQLPDVTHASWIATDALPQASFDGVTADRDALTMLQYTSGSTGSPKGVMLSHANIVANCAAVYEWLGPDPHRRGCIWLPPYHDMGLLGGILQPLFAGFPLVFLSPMHFVQKPVRWLQAISQHRITLSGGPNFAYQMCASDIPDEELEGLDLSCWKEAFCGAEPVRPDTLTAFCKRFEPSGFSVRAVNPCYGLAESTLIVSGKPPGQNPIYRRFDRERLEAGAAVDCDARGEHDEAAETDGSKEAIGLTSCGVVTSGYDLRIVDPAAGTELGQGQIGEIWVSGPSVAHGYWARPEETQRVFGCQLPGAKGPFLDTGDRGFLQDGQLYVTGRSKDLIIIAGKNHYSEDIEHTVESAHGSIYRGGAVAFSVEAGSEEAVIILAEVRVQRDRRDIGAIAQTIIAQVTQVHGVAPKEVVLCRRGSIARTTSGKVRRAASRALYLAGGLQQVA